MTIHPIKLISPTKSTTTPTSHNNNNNNNNNTLFFTSSPIPYKKTNKKNSSSSSSTEVIAATAGSDTWKTSAGRTTGSDSYEHLDLLRIPYRKFAKKFLWNAPTKKSGVVCPICLEDPLIDDDDNDDDDDDDEDETKRKRKKKKKKNQWHVTSACGHAVCLSCFRAYAASLVNDPEHTGPLKCPCCPQLLRTKDAIVALGGGHSAGLKVCDLDDDDDDSDDDDDEEEEIVKKWDKKIRDELLRALPNYRPCPKCDGRVERVDDDNVGGWWNGMSDWITQRRRRREEDESLEHNPNYHSRKNNKNSVSGGGFVTSECLDPIHSKRESDARQILDLTPYSKPTIIALFIIYWYNSITQQQQQDQQQNPSRCLHIHIFFLPLSLLLLPPLILSIQYLLATLARRTLLRPLTVECPCCDRTFDLHAQSEFYHDDNNTNTTTTTTTTTTISPTPLVDIASREWIQDHTRPCPNCSAPIVKTDGCNHMKCTVCKIRFCWACMRLSTTCQAFRCHYGAPFGNADWRGDADANADAHAADGGGTTNNREEEEDEENLGVVTRIQRMEYRMRMWMEWEWKNWLLMGYLSLIILIGFRDGDMVGNLAELVVGGMVAVFLRSHFILGCVLVLLVLVLGQRRRRTRRTRDDHERTDAAAAAVLEDLGEERSRRRRGRRRRRGDVVGLVEDRLAEQEIVAEVIARSIRDH